MIENAKCIYAVLHWYVTQQNLFISFNFSLHHYYGIQVKRLNGKITTILTVMIHCSDVSDLLVGSCAQNLNDGLFIGTSALKQVITD